MDYSNSGSKMKRDITIAVVVYAIALSILLALRYGGYYLLTFTFFLFMWNEILKESKRKNNLKIQQMITQQRRD
jgi:hypothetical protein